MQGSTKITCVNYFGGCPRCGGSDGPLGLNKDHWFVCHEHRVRWFVGSNLFSGWRDKTEDERRAEWCEIEDYEDIENPVPEGVWSADPAIREREIKENYRTQQEARFAMRRADAQRAEQIASFLSNALNSLPLPAGGMPRITVQIDDLSFQIGKGGAAILECPF
jgi:hypothetical protein